MLKWWQWRKGEVPVGARTEAGELAWHTHTNAHVVIKNKEGGNKTIK